MSVHVGEIRVQYDAERDVLYISRGNPRPGYGVPDDEIDNLIIRHDATTHEVVGVTIIGFKKTSAEKILARLPFPIDLHGLNLD